MLTFILDACNAPNGAFAVIGGETSNVRLLPKVSLLSIEPAGGAKEVHYFAYGSNMNWPQMQRRCPSSRFVSVGRLIDYQFGITRHSRLRNCGTANVYRVAGQEVWGIVYDITDKDLEILDGFEDGYRREILPVYPCENGQRRLAALVYIAAIEENVPPPSSEYRTLIIEGAKHWQLPPAYLALLEAIQVNAGR